jgi:hypothetical protein
LTPLGFTAIVRLVPAPAETGIVFARGPDNFPIEAQGHNARGKLRDGLMKQGVFLLHHRAPARRHLFLRIDNIFIDIDSLKYRF